MNVVVVLRLGASTATVLDTLNIITMPATTLVQVKLQVVGLGSNHVRGAMRKLLIVISLYSLFYGFGLLYMAKEKGVFDRYAYLLDDHEWIIEIFRWLP